MTTKLRTSGQSGMDVYVIIWDEDDKVWDGTSFVTFNASNADEYDIPLTETGSTGYYSGDFPSDIDAGDYHVDFRAELNPGTVDLTTPDDVIYQRHLTWNGEAIVDETDTGTSVTDICNLALSHLGIGVELSNYETDTSEEARACRRYYENVRDLTLREFNWPFATAYATLSLVAENPTSEWAYSYRYPGDCLMFRRILSGTRNDTRQSRVPYRVARDTVGRLIYSDNSDAIAEYTYKEVSPARYNKDYVMALSLRLAYFLAPRIMNGDIKRTKEELFREYMQHLQIAQANGVGEVQDEELPDSEFIRARS